MCVCTHKGLCFVCVWVSSNYLHQPGVVLIMCNFLKTDWALVIRMTLMVSLSKEFDKHYISWDWFFGGVGCPPTLPLPTSVYTGSDFFHPGLTSHQDELVFLLSLSPMLACISGPSRAYGCILAGQFMLVSSLILIWPYGRSFVFLLFASELCINFGLFSLAVLLKWEVCSFPAPTNWTEWGKYPEAGKETIGTQKAGAIGGQGKNLDLAGGAL